MKTVAIIGNPNSGKTTLFNLLTKRKEKVGNRIGVTVDKKESQLYGDKSVKIVDLPGLYSLSPKSEDELTVINYLTTTPPDIIINVIDGVNFEKDLLLTASIVRLNIPVILAVNKSDSMKKKGIDVNSENFKEVFGINSVQISATKNYGIEELKKLCYENPKLFLPNKNSVFFTNIKGDKEKDLNIIQEYSDKVFIKKAVKTRKVFDADKIFFHTYFGIPVFIAVIFIVYFLSFKLGGVLGNNISRLLTFLHDKAITFFTLQGVGKITVGLFNSVFSGVISVVSFLPQVTVLFLLISFLEQAGYLSRVSYLFDGLFSRLNLSGKTVVPFALSCGCTVTGVMSCRFIEDERERKRAVLLSSFLPCSAKTAVFGWFSHIFFSGSAFIAASCYFLGVLVSVITAKLLSLKDKKSEESSFVMEIPPLKIPEIKDVLNATREKAIDFLLKAGSVILTVSFFLWLLKSFGFSGYTEHVENSFLFLLGNGLRYLFIPLGFNGWEQSVALISGIFAKESVIASLTLTGVSFADGFATYSFMAFVLLSPPCAGALFTMRRELKGRKEFVFALLIQFTVGYAVSLLINIFGKLFSYNKTLIFSAFAFIIIAIALYGIFVKILKKGERL